MAYLKQAACAHEDSPRLTFSGWFRCPTASIPGDDAFPTLMTIAGLDHDDNPIATYIGVNESVNVYDSGDLTTITDTLTNGVTVACVSPSDDFPGKVGQRAFFASNGSVVTGQTWNHIFVSCDMSVDDSAFIEGGGGSDIDSHKLRYIWVNGADKLLEVSSGGVTTLPGISVQPFDIAFSGNEFAFPAGPGYFIELQPKLEYSDIQIWLGTYVDPAINIHKFISSAGRQVDTAVATRAFGKPTYLFSGMKGPFAINKGSGGAVTATGTITDFTPTPTVGGFP